jgi:hypothetical protein
LSDEITLLDPSCNSSCGAHFDEAAIVIEDFDAISVLDGSNLLVNLRDLIAEDGLNSGNVGDFKNASAAAIASGEKKSWREQSEPKQYFWERLHSDFMSRKFSAKRSTSTIARRLCSRKERGWWRASVVTRRAFLNRRFHL